MGDDLVKAILNIFNIARRPPERFPMSPRQPMPGRKPIHIIIVISRANSIGAQAGRRIG